jgi:hypothetical protein
MLNGLRVVIHFMFSTLIIYFSWNVKVRRLIFSSTQICYHIVFIDLLSYMLILTMVSQPTRYMLWLLLHERYEPYFD